MRRKMDGLLHDKTIIDATSGNTGIAYAALGTALGYKVTLCLPANATEERKKLIRLYGAEIIETDPLESSDGAYNECRRLVAEHPEKYYYPDQYNKTMTRTGRRISKGPRRRSGSRRTTV